MSLQSTSKIRIYTEKKLLNNVSSYLQDREILETISHSTEGVPSDFSLSKLEFAIGYLSQYQVEKKGIRNAVLGDRVEISESDYEKVLTSFDWLKTVSHAQELEAGKNDIVKELEEKKVLESVLEKWTQTEVLQNSNNKFAALFLEIPLQNFSLFERSIAEITVLHELEKVSADKKTVYAILHIDKKLIEEVSIQLSSYKGALIDLPSGGSPKEISKTLAVEIESLEKKQNANIITSRELAGKTDDLKMVYDAFLAKNALEKADVSAVKSDYVSYIEGWVPSNEVKMLQYDLENKFPSVMLEEIELVDGEEGPVLLSATENMKPIQEITKMYGTPAKNELDPTSYYAFFFVVFFGFCLTDAGYGLILMLLTGIPLLMNLPFESTVKNVVKMFFYGGISTFILGVLFGGYFGLTPEQVPESLTYIRESDGVLLFLGQVLNPMTDLVSRVMPITYALGVLHLFLGLYLSGKIAWKNGDSQRMLLVVIPTILIFLFGALSFYFEVAGMDYLLYLSLAVLVWGLGKNGNPFIRLLKGLAGLVNEILSWFQNILSYSRLFALGLATGVIGMAFNIVATTLGGMIPGFGGIIVMVMVLIFGHVLNIALNLLGAYVHSSRLQFVEFFGLFLQGGGKVFNPLKKEVRYRHLSDS